MVSRFLEAGEQYPMREPPLATHWQVTDLVAKPRFNVTVTLAPWGTLLQSSTTSEAHLLPFQLISSCFGCLLLREVLSSSAGRADSRSEEVEAGGQARPT